ncbi:hypothetical protein [Pedobacter sp. JCM 36344]|uniref:hypothetical protein n=1 Tax=Pedobacter sp. JCM 36344 TaxID=3374280 RepID=UPI00397A5918
MFNSLKDKFTLFFLNSIFNSYEAGELDTGKRLVSSFAGAYLLKKAIKDVPQHPYKAAQKFALSVLLLYAAASGLNKKIIKKPKELSDIRKNQIQGNDPHAIPAFV